MIKTNKNILLNNYKINYFLTVDSRAKHIKISIGFDGMKVTIPNGITSDFVEKFLQSKEKWIIEHYTKNKEVTNHQLYYKGDEITYKVVNGLNENSVELINNILNIYLNKELNSDEINSIIKGWYIKKAAENFNESIKIYSQMIGVKYNKISLREQKTRWGSCSGKGNLSFNLKLIMAPRYVLDYVVVHELCHLIHMNHSQNFWSEVERFMPDYKIAELWLKLNARKLNFNY